jgi:hypothetical protein
MVEQCRTPGIYDALSGMSWVFGWWVGGSLSEWRDVYHDYHAKHSQLVLGAVWKTLRARSDLSAVIFGRKTAHDSGFFAAHGRGPNV